MAQENEKGFNLPKAEEKILEFWKTNRIFEKSLQLRKNKKKFVFFEGPPTANGKPHIGHFLTRAFKDVILRYKTMRGYYVPRRAGWDTHGLPVEIEVEKQLGLKSKKEIEEYGIAKFNQKCRESVWKYKDEWERLTERMGFWIDLENPYITYESSYIETLWWIIAQFAKKKLLYKGHKVVPWCPRCGTSLSSHELAQGYKETEDNSVYVKFKLKPGQEIGRYFTTDENTYILSWTTTSWTLPGNVALAVGPNVKYVLISKVNSPEQYILAQDIFLKNTRDGGDSRIVNQRIGLDTSAGEFMTGIFERKIELKGFSLVGLEYEPLFDVKPLQSKTSYKIYPANFVTTAEGTGVVHTAVMYGEDDYQLGLKVGLPQHHTVDEAGKFTKEVPGLAGMPVKDSKTEEKIFEHLKKHGNLLRVEKYTHEYPYCWRCDTPVLYYARNSWFVAVSKIRDKLIENNKKINWTPAHLKEGRFGGWLKEAKDWNFSRERYWGTPLPVWECEKCKQHEVVGSLDELSKKAGGPKNDYWVMRHGEAESNIFHLVAPGIKGFHLTPRGRSMVADSFGKFERHLEKKKQKIDVIITSPITRTKETSEIDEKIAGLKKIVFDYRLREIQLGPTLAGCHDSKYHELYPTYESKFERRPEKGESLRDLRRRMWEFLEDTEKKYQGKNILIVSHEYPIWMLEHAASGWSEKEAIGEKMKRGDDFIKVAGIAKLDLKTLPRDETGLVDLHRPYADEIEIRCEKCGGAARRVKEVIDVWFDSGSMPYAQWHYPFENKNLMDKREVFPADYIVEAMDQTRGWFYTLLTVATLLERGAPYKNVISLGHVNDKFGQKMSKSKGNVIDPREVIEKYGSDAVRWYFYTASPPGEPKNFDENEILKVFRRFHLIIQNSIVFFNTYYMKSASSKKKASLKNILDRWIMSRLETTIIGATAHLEHYEVREAVLSIEQFVDDLSRWYIRRSRRRFQKPESVSDHRAATVTLGYALRELGKLIAPLAPFFGEVVYEALGEKNSVHLEDWPSTDKKYIDQKLEKAMTEVRRLASLGLAKRAEAGIKVRQPLGKLKISARGGSALGGKSKRELLDVLRDEVNVKEVVFDRKIQDEVELDTKITPELREEGVMRELIRMAQDLRQEAGLRPKDKIALFLELPAEAKSIVLRAEILLKTEVGAEELEYHRSGKFEAEISSKLEGQPVWLGIKKI